MTWYKDRDFPEVKASNADVVAVIENLEQLERVINEYNTLEADRNACRKLLKLSEEERGRLQHLIEECQLALLGGSLAGGVFWREDMLAKLNREKDEN